MPSNDTPPFEPPSDLIAVGRVLSSHGLRGEMKVGPLSDLAEHFAPGRRVWIDGSAHEIEASRWRKGAVLLKLLGVDSVEAADALRGVTLELPESELAPLSEGEYYAYQIVGLEVYDGNGERLGKVVGVFPTGSNDVYVVAGPHGELLLPAVDDVIAEIDVARGRMVVELMEGMLPGS